MMILAMKKFISLLFLLLCLCALAWFFLEDPQDLPSNAPRRNESRLQEAKTRKKSDAPRDHQLAIPDSSEATEKSSIRRTKEVRAQIILAGFNEENSRDWVKKAKIYLVQSDRPPILGRPSGLHVTWELPEQASGTYEFALEEELYRSVEEPREWFYKSNKTPIFAFTKRYRVDASLPGLQKTTLHVNARKKLTAIQVHVVDSEGQDVEDAWFQSSTQPFSSYCYFKSRTDKLGRCTIWLARAEEYGLRAYWSDYGSELVKVSQPLPTPVLFRLAGEPDTGMKTPAETLFQLKFNFGEQRYDELEITLYLKESWEKYKDVNDEVHSARFTHYTPKFDFVGKKGVYRVHVETRTREARFRLILDRRGIERVIDVPLEKKDQLTGIILLSDGRPAEMAGILLHRREDPNVVSPYSILQPVNNGRFKIYRHSLKRYLHVVEPHSEHSVTELKHDQTEYIIQLKSGSSLSGQLLNWAGQPVTGLTFSASTGKDSDVYAKTDENGAFSIQGLKATKSVILEIQGRKGVPDIYWRVRPEKGLQLRLPKTHSLELALRGQQNKAVLASVSAILLKQAKQYPNIKANLCAFTQLNKEETSIHGLLPGDYLIEVTYRLSDSFSDSEVLWKTITIPSSRSKLVFPLDELSSVKIVRGPLSKEQELNFHLIPAAIKRAQDSNAELPDDLDSIFSVEISEDDHSTIIEDLSPGQYWLSWGDYDMENPNRITGQWVTIAPNQTEQIIRLR